MPISLYDPSRYDKVHTHYTHGQSVKGGKKRANAARRDRWGRMLPQDNTVSIPDPVEHGKAGGKARIGKAKRNKLGQFTKG